MSSDTMFATKPKCRQFCPIFAWLLCWNIGQNFRHQAEISTILSTKYLSDKVDQLSSNLCAVYHFLHATALKGSTICHDNCTVFWAIVQLQALWRLMGSYYRDLEMTFAFYLKRVSTCLVWLQDGESSDFLNLVTCFVCSVTCFFYVPERICI